MRRTRSPAPPARERSGASIEDWDPAGGFIYELDRAVERVAAAVEAARALDFPFTLTARAENHFRGNPDLEDTIARLRAYEAAGADVLYAPALRSDEDIRAVCAAVSGPVNVLAFPDMTMERLAAAGAQRVSVGSWLSNVAYSAAVSAAKTIRDERRLLGARSSPVGERRRGQRSAEACSAISAIRSSNSSRVAPRR